MAKIDLYDVTAELRRAVECADMDGVVFRLTQISVEKRNAAGCNVAEEAYWQEILEVLQDTLAKLERLAQ